MRPVDLDIFWARKILEKLPCARLGDAAGRMISREMGELTSDLRNDILSATSKGKRYEVFL